MTGITAGEPNRSCTAKHGQVKKRDREREKKKKK
jgi:hypothetical protein